MRAVRRGHRDARRRGGARLRRSPTPASTRWREAMVGRRVQLGRGGACAGRRDRGRACCCRRSGLQWRDALGVTRLDDVSLTLRAGEIVGIAGVSGNGQSELLDVLSGLLRARRRRAAARRPTLHAGALARPATARALALAHVPEDRQRRGAGAAASRPGSRPCSATSARPRYSRRGWMRQRRDARRRARDDGALRRAPARRALRSVQVLRRQPAEARARARGDARAAGAAGRPADARRRHRRDRVHPRPPARDARRRRRGAGGVVASSTRSSRWPTACS